MVGFFKLFYILIWYLLMFIGSLNSIECWRMLYCWWFLETLLAIIKCSFKETCDIMKHKLILLKPFLRYYYQTINSSARIYVFSFQWKSVSNCVFFGMIVQIIWNHSLHKTFIFMQQWCPNKIWVQRCRQFLLKKKDKGQTWWAW